MSRLWILPAAVCLAALTYSAAQRADRLTSAAAGLLIVANKGDHSLGIVDPATGRQVATVPEGGVTGHELIASPDGKTAYVPIYGDSGVGHPGSDGRKMAVIDLASRKVVGNLDFGHGVRPHCPLFGPDGLLYVTTEIDNSVSVVDPRTLKIVGSVPTGQPESHMLAISRDGRLGYTSNVGPGTVSVLDLQARRKLAVIAVAPHVQRISLSPDDSLVFTSDTTQPRLAAIDTASRTVKQWIPLPAEGYGSASTSDGRWLLIAVPGANQVAAIDLRTLKVVHTIDVPKAPQEVLIRPDGRMAYASCDSSHQVAEIDLAAWKVNRLIDAGGGVDGLAWAAAQ
jgi:YVTN family beta-propeller protein